MQRKLSKRILAILSILVLITIVINPLISAEKDGYSVNKTVKNTDNLECMDETEKAKIKVQYIKEDGTIDEKICELSVRKIEDIKIQLEKVCNENLSMSEILEKQLGILKGENIISKNFTLEDITNKENYKGEKNEDQLSINPRQYLHISDNCFIAFFGSPIGGAIGSHTRIQGLGVDGFVGCLGYFPLIYYFNIFDFIPYHTAGIVVGGTIGFVGLLVLSLMPDTPHFYFPFVFGIGWAAVTAWINLYGW